MKQSIIKFLILSACILAASCHAPKKCITAGNTQSFTFLPVIALDSNAPALYSADFDVMKYHFSGLIAFRKMTANKETRIVFLTETGIRLMEFRYANHKIENTYCMDAMKKKSTIKFIGRFIRMLLTEPDCRSICAYEENDRNNIFCNTGNGYYTCKINNGVKEQTLFYNGKNKQIDAKYSDSQTLPDEIRLILPMHTNIQMKRAINAFK